MSAAAPIARRQDSDERREGEESTRALRRRNSAVARWRRRVTGAGRMMELCCCGTAHEAKVKLSDSSIRARANHLLTSRVRRSATAPVRLCQQHNARKLPDCTRQLIPSSPPTRRNQIKLTFRSFRRPYANSLRHGCSCTIYVFSLSFWTIADPRLRNSLSRKPA